MDYKEVVEQYVEVSLDRQMHAQISEHRYNQSPSTSLRDFILDMGLLTVDA